MSMKDFKPQHFIRRMEGDVLVIIFNRPERKNPVALDSHAERGEIFRKLVHADDVKAVLFGSNQGNFCSGGDVHGVHSGQPVEALRIYEDASALQKVIFARAMLSEIAGAAS